MKKELTIRTVSGLVASHQANTPENQHPVNVLQGFAPDNQQCLH